jgi:hypothetical protein
MGGLQPQFSPGPNGAIDAQRMPDCEYFYLAECGECSGVLIRLSNGHIAVWLPEAVDEVVPTEEKSEQRVTPDRR